jgi:hypothetical protein
MNEIKMKKINDIHEINEASKQGEELLIKISKNDKTPEIRQTALFCINQNTKKGLKALIDSVKNDKSLFNRVFACSKIYCSKHKNRKDILKEISTEIKEEKSFVSQAIAMFNVDCESQSGQELWAAFLSSKWFKDEQGNYNKDKFILFTGCLEDQFMKKFIVKMELPEDEKRVLFNVSSVLKFSSDYRTYDEFKNQAS